MSHCAIKLRCVLAIAAALELGVYPPRALAAGPDLDPGSKQRGKAPCSQVLWIGGYRANTPATGDCAKSSKPRDPHDRGRRRGYTDKDQKQAAREAHEFFKQERREEREAQKEKDRQAREDRKAKDKADREKREKAKGCRGLGSGADCTEPNPGHTKTAGSKPAKGKGRK